MRSHLNDLTVRQLPNGNTQYVWDATLPSFGVRVGKNRKTFVYKKDNRYHTLGHYPVISLKDAREKARTALYAKYLPQTALPACLAAERYLEAIKGQRRPHTVAIYSLYLKSLPNVRLSDLTPQLLYDALPQGKSAANLCFSTFKAFLSWCVERGYLQTNCLLKRKQPNKLKSRDRLLTDAEIRLIWSESYNHNSFGGLVRILILSGQRLNQIATLNRSWVTGHGTLQFPAYVMKNNTEHIIPLTPAVAHQLANYTPPDKVNKARAKFQRAVPISHFVPHDFRRYFSSTCSKLGIPIDVTEAILAHTTGSRTQIQRVYDRDSRLPQMRTALERYQQYVIGVVEQQ